MGGVGGLEKLRNKVSNLEKLGNKFQKSESWEIRAKKVQGNRATTPEKLRNNDNRKTPNIFNFTLR